MSVANLVYKNQIFDSVGEVQFAKWLDELQAKGYVKKWKRCKDREDSIKLTDGLKICYIKTTPLKTKIKKETKQLVLLRPSVYTPDFEIWFSFAGQEIFSQDVFLIKEQINPNKIFFSNFKNYSTSVLVEVKPDFDQQNMERLFVNNQKFLWQVQKTFVNLIEPVELFKKTFIPEAVRTDFIYKRVPKNKNKKPGDWKVDFEPRSLTQFIQTL